MGVEELIVGGGIVVVLLAVLLPVVFAVWLCWGVWRIGTELRAAKGAAPVQVNPIMPTKGLDLALAGVGALAVACFIAAMIVGHPFMLVAIGSGVIAAALGLLRLVIMVSAA